MTTLDLNCDLGEGAGFDAELVPLITSANVSCGAHAGTEDDILATLALCKQHGVTVGAHPGHADREHFGRRELPCDHIFDPVFKQVMQLKAWADQVGVPVKYIKPHGALYHQANRPDGCATSLKLIAGCTGLALVGLPGSSMERVVVGFPVTYVAEGFADRRYRADGTLVPRDQPDAMIDDPAEAVAQVLEMLDKGLIQTVCVHGDNPKAVEFVRAVREELLRKGVTLKAFA